MLFSNIALTTYNLTSSRFLVFTPGSFMPSIADDDNGGIEHGFPSLAFEVWVGFD